MSDVRDIGVSSYRPGGATLARMHASDALVRLCAGPIGSGKTTAACWEAIFTVMLQTPGPDGVRRAKVGMLRDTYRNLYGTTLETWFKSFPRELGHFVGSDDRPFKHTLSFPAPLLNERGEVTGQWGVCELVVEGRALGANSVEATCRGWELMMAYVDEIDLCPEETIPYLKGRTMRGGDVRFRRSRGVLGTFNKPDLDHYLYRVCVEEPMDGMDFFDQPSGLLPGMPYRTNPGAENLAMLDPDYYIRSAQGADEWYVTRMLRNMWGASVAGERIYPGFRRERHVSPTELAPRPRSELFLGMDGGGTPAAVIMGRDEMTGRRIVYAELVLTDPTDPRGRRLLYGCGPARFSEALNDLVAWKFPNCRVTRGHCDPAAFYGTDREYGELGFPETVQHKTGIPIMPAPSNEVGVRHDSVKELMHRDNRLDGRPDLIINPSCRFLIRGYEGDYKWQRRDPKEPSKLLKAQKSDTSHVHDGLQYGCLGDQGRAGVVAGQKFDRAGPPREHTATTWSDGQGGALQGVPAMPWERQAGGQSYGTQGGGASYNSDFDLWG